MSQCMQKSSKDRWTDGMAPEPDLSHGVARRFQQLKATPLRVRLCYQQAPANPTYEVRHKMGGAIELSGMYAAVSGGSATSSHDNWRLGGSAPGRLPTVRGAMSWDGATIATKLPVNINLNLLGEDEDSDSSNHSNDDEDYCKDGLSYKWNFERPDVCNQNNCIAPKFRRSKTEITTSNLRQNKTETNHYHDRKLFYDRNKTTFSIGTLSNLRKNGSVVSSRSGVCDSVKEKLPSATTSVQSNKSQASLNGDRSSTVATASNSSSSDSLPKV